MKTKLFNCYQVYKKKTCTLDVCRNQIIELVFKNKKYFQLQNLPEDLQSNLIILLHNSLESILNKYDPKYGSFVTYLAATIKGLRTRCFREYYRKQATETISTDYCRNFTYNQNDINPIDEVISSITNNAYEKQILFPQKNFYVNKELINNNLSRIILVITLKSSYYINPDMIKKISYYTKLSAEEIEKMCTLVKESLKPRIERYRKKMQQINREFLLKNRSFHELQYQEKGTYTYETRLKAYQFHKKRWITMITNKPKPSYLCPRNHEIANLLQISEDQVYYILHKYKDPTNSQKLLNGILLEHDTIYGNREPKQKN
ncbi:MAG: hypothetical protein BKP49_00955 [Treponema sp. CETP13]|nr:MAG: hypothetical protein BKP49_00955 [Treponema sp. CETP13]